MYAKHRIGSNNFYFSVFSGNIFLSCLLLFLSWLAFSSGATPPVWKGSCTGLTIDTSARLVGLPPTLISTQFTTELKAITGASYCAQNYEIAGPNTVQFVEILVTKAELNYRLEHIATIMDYDKSKGFQWDPIDNENFCSCHCPASANSGHITPCPYEYQCDQTAYDTQYPPLLRQPSGLQVPACNICTIIEGSTWADGCVFKSETSFWAKGIQSFVPRPLWKLTSDPGSFFDVETCVYDSTGTEIECVTGTISATMVTVPIPASMQFNAGAHPVTLFVQEKRTEFKEGDYFTSNGDWTTKAGREVLDNLFRIPSEYLAPGGSDVNLVGWVSWEQNKQRLLYNEKLIYEAVHSGIYLTKCNGQECHDATTFGNLDEVFLNPDYKVNAMTDDLIITGSTSNLDIELCEPNVINTNLIIGLLGSNLLSDATVNIIGGLQITSIICAEHNPLFSNVNCQLTVTGVADVSGSTECQLNVDGRGGQIDSVLVTSTAVNTFNISVPAEDFPNGQLQICINCLWSSEANKVCSTGTVVIADPELNPEEDDPNIENGIETGVNTSQSQGGGLYNSGGGMHSWAIGMFVGISLGSALIILGLVIWVKRAAIGRSMNKFLKKRMWKSKYRTMKEQQEMMELEKKLGSFDEGKGKGNGGNGGSGDVKLITNF
jgi:hypothetical protein